MAPCRRFPPPWTVKELAGCFAVVDANGQDLAWHYFRDDEWSAHQANVLTKDEARRIAANVARLPELLKQKQ